MENNMTSTELQGILRSKEFRQDLEELSSYLASVQQERPIVFLLAKHLWKNKRKFRLEDEHKDLFVDDTHLEFKVNHDKMARFLEPELAKWNNLEDMWAAVRAGVKSKSWGVIARIYEEFLREEASA